LHAIIFNFSVGDLPPGEVMQIVWNGIPCFIRRITKEEIKQEDEYPKETILDPGYLDIFFKNFICSAKRLFSTTQAKLRSLFAVHSALTWDASQFPTWALTM
jgi:hypothetical protein